VEGHGDQGRDAPGDGANREPLRAIVADNDPLARRTIKDALQLGDVTVIAEAANGREAIELCLHYRPDIVLMDLVMPEIDGIAATRRILQEIPGQLIIILTSSAEQDMGILSLRAGAAGFLSKEVDLEVLPRAIDGVLAGEAVFSRQLGRVLVEELRQQPEHSTGMRPVKSPLTTREWEVIDLLSAARSTDEIADTLVLSQETVRSHVKNILRKLSARSRGEAVKIAEQMRGPSSPA
jgi:NarL family two-component system response regulator LiaR